MVELVPFLIEKNILLASIFSDFPNFQTLSGDRPGERGGCCFLSFVHQSIQYKEFSAYLLFPNDLIVEHYGFTIKRNDRELKTINIYIPPISSCPTGYFPILCFIFKPLKRTPNA